MRDIDFLPSRYREENAQRQKHFWRVVVVTTFLALLTMAAVGQYQRRRGVERLLEFTRQRYQATMDTAHALGQVHLRLERQTAKAELIVYLRHPWPRTQVLAAVLRPLPDSVRIDRLTVGRERPSFQQSALAAPSLGAGGSATAVTDDLHPSERDLQRLRDEIDSLETVVILEGLTDDSSQLHEYVGQLADCELFAAAELASLESVRENNTNRARFTARLVVRPGYGQPGGPRPDLEAPGDASNPERQAALSTTGDER